MEGGDRQAQRLIDEAESLRALPAFPKAMRDYIANLVRFREEVRLNNKLLTREIRFRTVWYLLYLDADRENSGPDGGVPYGRLLDICTRREEISPRVLKTMLALLARSGLVAIRRGSTDRRLTFYHPTERLIDLVRQRMACAARALDLLQPDARRMHMLHSDPHFIPRALTANGRAHAAGTSPAALMPEFMSFYGGREGAAPIVFSVMLADIDGATPPSRAEIARRFGLSKTQVVKTITQGMTLGYFAFDAASVLVPTPHLRDSLQRWIAIELGYTARHMQPG